MGRAIFDRPAHAFLCRRSNKPGLWDVLLLNASRVTAAVKTVLLITALASLAALVAWMFWAASRILRPVHRSSDRRLPEGRDRVRLLAGTRAVRFRDIRSREAERMATVPGDTDYLYEDGYSIGLPDEWTDDLMLRRN